MNTSVNLEKDGHPVMTSLLAQIFRPPNIKTNISDHPIIKYDI